jgi:MFS family permease
MATAVAETHTQRDSTPFYAAVIIVIVGFLATTLGQPQGVARIPFQNLLKNSLGVGRTANAAFFFWIGLPWYFKPVVGVFTDAFPLFGSRRKSYILVNTVLATIAWFGLLLAPVKYGPLLWFTIVIDFFMVIVSTVLGAYMVEVGQATSGTGRITAIRQLTYWFTMMANGPVGGFLATLAFSATIYFCGGIMFMIFPVALFLLREQRRKTDPQLLLQNARQQMINIGTAGTMWATAGLMALFYIAPGFQTALFYRQQDFLHMSTEGIGSLLFLQGVGGLLATAVYGFSCRRLNLRNLLLICLTAATVVDLGYVLYSTIPRARIIDFSWGFGFALAECALMDLAVRSTPKGSEGMGFSLMISVRNFALFGTDAFGSWLMDRFHIQFNSLIVSNAVTTAIAIPLVLLLPLYLVGRKDAEPPADPAATHTTLQQ